MYQSSGAALKCWLNLIVDRKETITVNTERKGDHVWVDTSQGLPFDELFLDAVNHGTDDDVHPNEIIVHGVHGPQTNEAYNFVWLPTSASSKGTPSLWGKLTPEMEKMCWHSISSSVSTPTALTLQAIPSS